MISGFRVSWFQGFVVSWFRGFVVSWFHRASPYALLCRPFKGFTLHRILDYIGCCPMLSYDALSRLFLTGGKAGIC